MPTSNTDIFKSLKKKIKNPQNIIPVMLKKEEGFKKKKKIKCVLYHCSMVCNFAVKSRILFSAPWILVLYYFQAARLEIQPAYVHLYTHS